MVGLFIQDFAKEGFVVPIKIIFVQFFLARNSK